jgi:hypothetical protein
MCFPNKDSVMPLSKALLKPRIALVKSNLLQYKPIHYHSDNHHCTVYMEFLPCKIFWMTPKGKGLAEILQKPLEEEGHETRIHKYAYIYVCTEYIKSALGGI